MRYTNMKIIYSHTRDSFITHDFYSFAGAKKSSCPNAAHNKHNQQVELLRSKK